MYRLHLEFPGFKKILVTSWIVSLSLQEILTWHQDRSVSKGLTRRWENYRNCNLAALRPSIRVWPALIRWHTRSLAHRWRAGEASSSLQHPLELLSFSTFVNISQNFCPTVDQKASRCMDSCFKTCPSTSSKSAVHIILKLTIFPGRAMDQGNGSRYRKRWKSKRWF